MMEKTSNLTMTKKERSPEKPQASPNPRPRRRNKKHRESAIRTKKQDSPSSANDPQIEIKSVQSDTTILKRKFRSQRKQRTPSKRLVSILFQLRTI
jgi:hypothetical protein